MKRILTILLFIAASLSSQAQTLMPIGPQSSTFSGMTRGYHFTAPVAFNMCALYIPQDASAGTLQTIWVVRFNVATGPPAFPGTTTAYTTLFSAANVAANTTVACNVAVNPGDIIGIYGSRAAGCVNSYDGANFATTIMGNPTVLRRSGTQNCINGITNPTFPIWSEVNFSIGRIFMYYNCCPTPTITAVASATNICAGTNVAILGGGATTYTWMPGNANTASISVTPTVSTTYTLSGSTAGCVGTNTVAVNVASIPNYTVTPTTVTVCQNGVFTPSVVFGALPGTPCSTTGVGPACSAPTQLTLGNGAAVNNIATYPAPYAKWWNDAHQQYLYLASELTAAGVLPGYLTSLSFNVTNTNGAGTFPNYTIKMKCTAAATAASFDMAGLTTVYNSPLYNPANGWNVHNFPTPYYWDGTSNILIDICFNNGPWSVNASSPFTTTPFISCIYNFAIGAGSTCGTTAFMGTSANRPNTRFGNCSSANPSAYSFSWSPGPGIAAPTASSTAITVQPITVPQANVIYTVVVTPTLAYCPVAQTLTATIINPPTPTLTPAGPFCNTNGTVALTATPGGGTWSASAAVTAGGVFTPSLATIGTNTIVYSVGVGQCVATNTMFIDVSQFNTANITGSVGPQCHSFPAVNLMGLVQSVTNGTWTGTAVNSNSFIPTGLQTGVYTLTYNTTSSPNPTLCPDSQTLNISVINPVTPTITADIAYCNNMAPVQLSVTPANTGTWIVTGYLNNTGIFTPSLALTGPNVVQYVVGTVTCSSIGSTTINIENYVPAIITGTAPDKCTSDPIMSLAGYVTVQSGTWAGPGVTGATFDPATSGVGALTLTYTTHSLPTVSLCPSNAMLTVNVYSLATPVITPKGPYCNIHSPVKMNATPLGGHFYALGNGPFGGLDVNGVFNPANAKIGVNVISYSIVSGPCLGLTQTTINVEAYVMPNIIKVPGPFCKNDPAINLFSYAQFLGGTFSGDGVIGNAFDPSKANIGDNNVITYRTHSIPTESLCPDSASFRIKINDYPHVTVNSSAEKGCLPLEILFNTPEVNSGTGVWNFGDGSGDIFGLNVMHTFTNSGNYIVKFTYSDEVGCKATATLPGTVTVYPNPTAAFVFDPSEGITMASPAVNFTNLSTVLGHNTYLWQIGNMYTLKDVNPRVVFPAAGDYYINLTATSAEGCKADYGQMIYVKNDFGVYIPSAFSPNFDGLNDYFLPILSPFGLDLEFFELEVFDRWGISLFYTKQYGMGWDGTKNNKGDEFVKEGVYIYKMKFKDMEGKIHHKTGHVSLLK